MTGVVVDVAGGRVGGAMRFLAEFNSYMASSERTDVLVIGLDSRLDPAWLLRRELLARGHELKVAINNASFRFGGHRVVALRNALHFATDEELSSLSYQPPRSLRAQIPVIRGLARRADQVEVPCSAMAERVRYFLPEVQDRIFVRLHPLTPRPWSRDPVETQPQLLMPIVNSPYKRLDLHLRVILEAAQRVPVLTRILVTAKAEEFPDDIATDPRVEFLGLLSHEDLDAHFARSRAIYFPTQIESFGYPLAEARANGRRVVALDTDQSREIAGTALAAFEFGNADSLAAALEEAMTVPVTPDGLPFEPHSYFDTLLKTPRS